MDNKVFYIIDAQCNREIYIGYYEKLWKCNAIKITCFLSAGSLDSEHQMQFFPLLLKEKVKNFLIACMVCLLGK